MSNDYGFDFLTARALSIEQAFLLGMLAGAAMVTAVLGFVGGPVETGPDPGDPPFTSSSGCPNWFDGEVAPNAGCVHEVAVSDSCAVTLNATIVHDAGTEVQAGGIPWSGNGYELALRTVSVTMEQSFDYNPCPDDVRYGSLAYYQLPAVTRDDERPRTRTCDPQGHVW